MSTAYEQEQMTLKAEAAALQQEIEAQNRRTEELERFIHHSGEKNSPQRYRRG